MGGTYQIQAKVGILTVDSNGGVLTANIVNGGIYSAINGSPQWNIVGNTGGSGLNFSSIMPITSSNYTVSGPTASLLVFNGFENIQTTLNKANPSYQGSIHGNPMAIQ